MSDYRSEETARDAEQSAAETAPPASGEISEQAYAGLVALGSVLPDLPREPAESSGDDPARSAEVRERWRAAIHGETSFDDDEPDNV
ncbi:MAG: hypothetical protein ACJ74O_06245 [Frankiaceae bacterium]